MKMLYLLVALMLAPGASIGENRILLRDPQQGPTPVTDKYLVANVQIRDCANPEEVQRAQEERIKGWDPECVIPKKAKDQNPH
jgi:hypothetical protein